MICLKGSDEMLHRVLCQWSTFCVNVFGCGGLALGIRIRSRTEANVDGRQSQVERALCVLSAIEL